MVHVKCSTWQPSAAAADDDDDDDDDDDSGDYNDDADGVAGAVLVDETCSSSEQLTPMSRRQMRPAHNAVSLMFVL